MGKKLLYTPNVRIKKALYMLFLRSRERNHLMKGAECAKCGSKEHLQAHHINGVNWDRIFVVLREELLTDNLIPLCQKCHQKLNIKYC